MMLGIDIMDVDRFVDMDNERLSRIFSAREIEYFQKKNMAPETIAGMFCAKEAFFKALGTGITPANILKLEVLHGQSGAPHYHFHPDILAQHQYLSTSEIKVSISNTKRTSVAVCIILKQFYTTVNRMTNI